MTGPWERIAALAVGKLVDAATRELIEARRAEKRKAPPKTVTPSEVAGEPRVLCGTCGRPWNKTHACRSHK